MPELRASQKIMRCALAGLMLAGVVSSSNIAYATYIEDGVSTSPIPASSSGSPATVEGPDLMVQASLSTRRLCVGESAYIIVSVANTQSYWESPSSWLSATGDVTDWWPLGRLGGDHYPVGTQVWIPVSMWTPGTKTVRLEVGGSVPDANPDDNVWTLSFEVDEQNVAISELGTPSKNPAAGEPLTFSSRVAMKDIRDSSVAFGLYARSVAQEPVIGDAPDTTRAVSAFEGTRTIDFELPGRLPGVYHVYALADHTGTLTEVSESDNLTGPQVVRVGTNLTAQGDGQAYRADDAGEVALGGAITNAAATQPAPATVARVLATPGPVYEASSAIEIARVSVSALAAGERFGMTLSATLPGYGLYHLWLEADAVSAVAEYDESDNRAYLGSAFWEAAEEPEPPAEATLLSVGGTDRYGTAIAASRLAFAEAHTVVIATGEEYPDALAGASLAGAAEGPILLTRKGALPAEIAAEIERLGAEKVYILGGASAVSPGVETQLRGLAIVVRLEGADRYATARRVAEETIRLLGDGYRGGAFVTTGANYPDALGASPIAAVAGMPVLLAHPSRMQLELPAAVTDVVLVGGTDVVSESMEQALTARLGAGKVARLGGADRYETAARVANAGVAEHGLGWQRVGIAVGTAYPDALVAGPALGSVGSVLLLVGPGLPVPPATRAALVAHGPDIEQVRCFGSYSAVPQPVRDTVMRAVRGE